MSGQVCDVVYALPLVLKHKQLAVRPATLTSWQWGSFKCSLECVTGAAEPADMKVESHQQSSTMFHTPALTGLPGEKKAAQTTLELCPVTVHQPSKVKLAELWERGERHLSLSRPARPAGEWQHINKARPPQPPATKSRSSRGSVLHPPNQPRSRTQTWLPRALLTNCR